MKTTGVSGIPKFGLLGIWDTRSCKHVWNHSFQSRMQGSQRCRKCCSSLSALPCLGLRKSACSLFVVANYKNWGRFQHSDDFAEDFSTFWWLDHLGCWANTVFYIWWLDHFLPEQVGMAENKGKGWRHRIGMMTYQYHRQYLMLENIFCKI